ncbi:DUF6114 domain-containing protein [Rhodococcus oxybenzonivorans]|uniref:DUF6114 domain-containing protein n=1 Tax=Rhodococcus oxybenzonivorans TaxID=1990687 RepID=UPI002953B9A7|nr:DUF6114 domain-containing protein [Rhodococcus oxybenzonivorans]MDV7353796.1 DUF6114 domain-containing protein [Rhodococcus oxybenzonivorans]
MLTAEPPLTRRERFRHWRGMRPFGGAVMLTVSAVFLLLPAYSTLEVGDLLISISTISGVSTLFLGASMLLCAGSVLVRPKTRVTAGGGAMLLALVALPAANFGGFGVGTLMGVLGAAATLAWTDRSGAPPAETAAPRRPPTTLTAD